MNKIVVNDNVISEILSTSKTANEVLGEMYEDEIQDRIAANEKYKGLKPLDMAMMDAGISKKSTIKDFTTQGASDYLLPVFIDSRLREGVGENNILSYLTAGNEVGVDSLSVMAAHLDLQDEKNKKNISRVRVSEGADIPLAEIKLGESAIRLFKYGRAVEATYEALQYLRVDLFNRTLDAIANDVAQQEVGMAIDTLINGDGNDNASEVMETATADTLTEDDVLNAVFQFQAKSNLPITTIVATEKFYKQLLKMFHNTGTVNGILGGITFRTPQFNMGEVNLIADNRIKPASAKESIVLLNNQFALTKYFANGSNIREIQRNIRNQTQLGTISEISAFAKFRKEAVLMMQSK